MHLRLHSRCSSRILGHPRWLLLILLALITAGVMTPRASAVLNAEQNRWMTRDPAGYVDGANLYQYARTNPINFIDSDGLEVPPGGGVIPSSCPLDGQSGEIIGQGNFATAHGGLFANQSAGQISGVTPPTWVPNWYIKSQQCLCDAYMFEESLDLSWLAALPDCPCNIGNGSGGFVNPNPKVWHDPSATEGNPALFHAGASVCMRSNPIPGSHSGQQCCYDSSGSLITWGGGAGTPDRYSPDYNVVYHFLSDVNPWAWCQFAGWPAKYWAVRPPNPGRLKFCFGIFCVNVPCPKNP